jgi:hypothetical protein
MSLPNFLTSDDFNMYPTYLIINEINGEETLNAIITQRQMSLLKMLLGSIEYNKMSNDFVNGSFQSTKYNDFINGKSYTVNGKPVVWSGFKQLLKYFVFYDYLRNKNIVQSTIANTSPKTENSNVVSGAVLLATVYNLGVDMYGLDIFNLFITTFKYTDNNNTYKYSDTAYNYLYQNRLDFTDWKFIELKKANSFNI